MFESATESAWRRWRVVVMVARKVYTITRSSAGRFRKSNTSDVSDGWGESVPVWDGVGEDGEGVLVSEGVSDISELEAVYDWGVVFDILDSYLWVGSMLML
jgi:hypothetical protein